MKLLGQHRKTGSLLQLAHHCWESASGVQCDDSPRGCVSGYGESRSVWSVAVSEIVDEGSGRAGHSYQFRTT
jgi:hypothetical protein